MRKMARSIVIAALIPAVMVLLAGMAFAASVTPEHIDGAENHTCSEFAGQGQTWTEFKIDPPGDGLYHASAGDITISNYDGTSFDWSSTFGVDAVFVKSGSHGHNLYRYDPPAESTGDTDLESPDVEPQQQISHISFCWDGEVVQSPPPSTPPSSPPSTGGTTTAKPAAKVLGRQLGRALPATGSQFPEVPIAGLALIAAGIALLAAAHMRTSHVLAEARRETIGDWATRLDSYLSLRKR